MSQDAQATVNPCIDDILNQFPFRRNNNQKQKLTEYLKYTAGYGVRDIANRTGMSPTTVRKIRTAYQNLNPREKAVFLQELTADLPTER